MSDHTDSLLAELVDLHKRHLAVVMLLIVVPYGYNWILFLFYR